uniref:N-acetyltransferase eso1 n=1 Tax=Lygus hesperus TaxID=30085 RepID=A0A0A9WUR5_LYGHE
MKLVWDRHGAYPAQSQRMTSNSDHYFGYFCVGREIGYRHGTKLDQKALKRKRQVDIFILEGKNLKKNWRKQNLEKIHVFYHSNHPKWFWHTRKVEYQRIQRRMIPKPAQQHSSHDF